jgi:hypothetical protein
MGKANAPWNPRSVIRGGRAETLGRKLLEMAKSLDVSTEAVVVRV